MNKFKSIKCVLLITLVIFLNNFMIAADSLKIYAFKNSIHDDVNPFRIKPDNTSARLWDVFLLVRSANSGNQIAQHELGLRYLMGKAFLPDTQKAVYWIQKAADQNYLPAKYNLGILFYNGYGVEWNPFEAYKNFKYAALNGLTEAEYAYGLLLTDNLIVPRNYKDAFRWIKIAADSGYEQAKDILTEFDRKGITAYINSYRQKPVQRNDTTRPKIPTNVQSTVQPVYLEFYSDSISKPDNKLLLRELLLEYRNQFDKELNSNDSVSIGLFLDTNSQQLLRNAAKWGSPEALTLIGYLYEQGISVKRDPVQASVYYLRAIHLDSPHAPIFLWNMIQDKEYFHLLKTRVDSKDAAATFVWAGLVLLGFDNKLTESQAFEFLEQVAADKFPYAVVRLALCYYSGYGVLVDKEKAVALLEQAQHLGSQEARVRLCMIRLMNDESLAEVDELINILQQSAHKGSVLAEAALGYCYQKGKGVIADKSESVRWYRLAARRGSKVAYAALKEMHDNLRPEEIEFQVQDDE